VGTIGREGFVGYYTEIQEMLKRSKVKHISGTTIASFFLVLWSSNGHYAELSFAFLQAT
jgi:hypothetical protein